MSAQAAVLLYQNEDKKWVPTGPSNGAAKISLYKNDANMTYRIVARNIANREVRVLGV